MVVFSLIGMPKFLFRKMVPMLALLVLSHQQVRAGDPIQIPFQYAQSFILIEVKINQLVKVKLIFDTGAEHHILFDRIYTDLFDGIYTREVKVMGADLDRELNAMVTLPLKNSFPVIGDLQFPWVVLNEPGMSMSGWIGEEVHGILSAQCFSNYFLEIDYGRNLLILHDHLKDRKVQKYKSCPMRLIKNKPYIQSGIMARETSDTVILDLLLDTGAGVPLLLYEGEKRGIPIPDKVIPGSLGSGLGGKLDGVVGKISELCFCDFVQREVPSYFQSLHGKYVEKELQVKQGIIGNQILEFYSVILDYRNERVYFKSSSKRSGKFRFDKSGMSLVAGGTRFRNFYITQIIPGSPADEIGLLPGDEIIKMNLRSGEFLSLTAIQKILSSKSGDRVKLKILRNREILRKEIVLRDLI